MKSPFDIKELVADSIILAIREDIATGDITSIATVSNKSISNAVMTAKSNGVICGLNIAGLVLMSIDKNVKFVPLVKEGAIVKKGKVIAKISGPTRGILTGERIALNYVQRMSGIATLTRNYVKKVAFSKAKILDTRKTTPGMRMLEKYAVKMGGGNNHRLGLNDAVLIKDNHILAAAGIPNAVSLCKKRYPGVKIEVETKDMSDVKEALSSSVDRIMLDNMSLSKIRAAVKTIRNAKKYTEIEVSGGANIKKIVGYARTGVDYISVGSLTHSAPALDINLKIK